MNKEELVEKLLTEGHINFKEALMLMDKVVGSTLGTRVIPDYYWQNPHVLDLTHMSPTKINKPYWQVDLEAANKMFYVDVHNPMTTYTS